VIQEDYLTLAVWLIGITLFIAYHQSGSILKKVESDFFLHFCNKIPLLEI